MVVHITITTKNQIIEKNVGEKIYVYEREPYYNSRIKNTSNRYSYVGNKENGKIRITLPRRSLIHGPFIPLLGIVREASLEELLSKQLLAMTISKIVRPLLLSSLETWREEFFSFSSRFSVRILSMKRSRSRA